MLTMAFGKSTMSRIQVQLLCNRFKEGREDVNSEHVNKRWKHWSSKKMESDNHGITIREIADDVGIPCSAYAKQFLQMF